MSIIAYFKKETKTLLKYYKAQRPDDHNLCLMKAQHQVSRLVGFDQWTDLLKASEPELHLAKLIFDNPDIVDIKDWKSYISAAEQENRITFNSYERLEIFKKQFLKIVRLNYSFNQDLDRSVKKDNPKITTKPISGITSLPLKGIDRAELIDKADRVFEATLDRIKPTNPELIRKLWNVDDYVDNLLTQKMLPVSRDYALSLIDAFLLHYVIGLARQADEMSEQSCVSHKKEQTQKQKLTPDMQITSLPLNKEDRVEFIETANSVFETVMELMEACNPELTRKLWDVEDYVDNLLTEDMLPISRDYALSLIEPFMVQLVAELAAQADKMAEQS